MSVITAGFWVPVPPKLLIAAMSREALVVTRYIYTNPKLTYPLSHSTLRAVTTICMENELLPRQITDPKTLQAGKEFGMGKTSYGTPTEVVTILHSPYINGRGEIVINVHVTSHGDHTARLSDLGLDSDAKPGKWFLTEL